MTAYINGTEIRNYGQSSEVMVNHLTDEVRVTREGSTTKEHFLHHDQLGSVIAISRSNGTHSHRRSYHPFGDISNEVTNDPDLEEETIGFIGERYDEDAELQYLNARYYDPKLALFIQPDWFPVTEPGVGTNRFSYAFNDPINLSDPNGNCANDGGCAGDWSGETTKTADNRQNEDGVADAATYEGRETFVIDPKAIGMEGILDLGRSIQGYIDSGTNTFSNSDLNRAINASKISGEPEAFSIEGLGIGVDLAEKAFTEAGRIFGDFTVNIEGKISANADGSYSISEGIAEINQRERYNFNKDSRNPIVNFAIGIGAVRLNPPGPNNQSNLNRAQRRKTQRFGHANIVTETNRSYNFNAAGQLP